MTRLQNLTVELDPSTPQDQIAAVLAECKNSGISYFDGTTPDKVDGINTGDTTSTAFFIEALRSQGVGHTIYENVLRTIDPIAFQDDQDNAGNDHDRFCSGAYVESFI